MCRLGNNTMCLQKYEKIHLSIESFMKRRKSTVPILFTALLRLRHCSDIILIAFKKWEVWCPHGGPSAQIVGLRWLIRDVPPSFYGRRKLKARPTSQGSDLSNPNQLSDQMDDHVDKIRRVECGGAVGRRRGWEWLWLMVMMIRGQAGCDFRIHWP